MRTFTPPSPCLPRCFLPLALRPAVFLLALALFLARQPRRLIGALGTLVLLRDRGAPHPLVMPGLTAQIAIQVAALAQDDAAGRDHLAALAGDHFNREGVLRGQRAIAFPHHPPGNDALADAIAAAEAAALEHPFLEADGVAFDHRAFLHPSVRVDAREQPRGPIIVFGCAHLSASFADPTLLGRASGRKTGTHFSWTSLRGKSFPSRQSRRPGPPFSFFRSSEREIGARESALGTPAGHPRPASGAGRRPNGGRPRLSGRREGALRRSTYLDG